MDRNMWALIIAVALFWAGRWTWEGTQRARNATPIGGSKIDNPSPLSRLIASLRGSDQEQQITGTQGGESGGVVVDLDPSVVRRLAWRLRNRQATDTDEQIKADEAQRTPDIEPDSLDAHFASAAALLTREAEPVAPPAATVELEPVTRSPALEAFVTGSIANGASDSDIVRVALSRQLARTAPAVKRAILRARNGAS